jgi:hypothetical protein
MGQPPQRRFFERTLEFRIEGDMPPIARGRYAIVPAEKFRMVVMQANLWREKQKDQAA